MSSTESSGVAAVSPESGLELNGLSPEISAADDLFGHVNQLWLDAHPIPPDKSLYGAFSILAERAERDVLAIVERCQEATEGALERQVGDAFASFMDVDTIERRGLLPLQQRLEEIRQLGQDRNGLIRAMAICERRGASGLWHMFIDNDPGDPERYIAFIEQGGISLPDESYYREEQFEPIREAFVRHLERVAELVGIDDPAGFAHRVFDVELRIASSHWDQVRCRDAQQTYNLTTSEQWQDLAQGFDLTLWLETIGIPGELVSEVVVRQPSAVEYWPKLWESAEPQALGEWIQWQTIRHLSGYLTEELVQAHFDFFGRTLSGTPELRARWKRGVAFVEAILGEAVGKLYVDEHFPPRAKEQMDHLVEKLMDAYRLSITELGWMSEETKHRALEKLSTFRPKIGYPDKWRDYSGLRLTPDDVIANVEASAEFEFRREVSKLGKPLDRDEWFMTPQTVNAYYNPGFNEIVFPAAILQYPFFDPDRDAASNYGAIGAVIGHEIGHGFDDQGSRFDGQGRLTDWWTTADRQSFEALTAQLVEQYNQLEPRQLSGLRVNGELTLGENIGDLGGLGIAWKAYLLSLEGQAPPEVDGLSAAQRFLISWAQSWRLQARDEEAKRLLQIDPHSPAEFRCNQIVRNLEIFYEAFEVSEEDQLWLAPEKRVTIW